MVTLYDNDERTAAALRDEGFCVVDTPEGVCVGSDLVLIATPVNHTLSVAAQLAPHLEDGTIVTELGSVKAPVRGLAEVMRHRPVHVVSAHPMAGSEKSGFTASGAGLLNSSTWLISTDEDTPAVDYLVDFLTSIGASRCLRVAPDAHDVVVAVVSHLPQMASTLTAVVTGDAARGATEGSLAAAGNGFRDTTRLAESPIAMWMPVLESNGVIVAGLLRDLARQCAVAADALENGDMQIIEELFRSAQAVRSEWRAAQGGSTPEH